MVNIDKSRRHLVHRKTLEGDIYYDTDTRKVYRDGADIMPVLSQDLYSLSTFDSRSPLKVYFDFTYLCNLECRHCITNSSPQVNRQNELPSERIVSIMNELASLGVLEIGVGGGEPLCRSDIFSLLDHARAIGLNVVLTTNGILVTSEIAKRLKEYQVSEVRVSFDGSQTVHDSIRGTGNYQKALKAVRVLMQNAVKTVPRITLCNDDRPGLDMLFKELALTGVSTVKAS
jgi:MoaA/NifB/PqqE/SkfB family radical SAM enzyme